MNFFLFLRILTYIFPTLTIPYTLTIMEKENKIK